MRTIKKRQPPQVLVQWRQKCIAKADPATDPFDYSAMRTAIVGGKAVVEAVEIGLFREQGELCAYTGRKLALDSGPPQYAWFHLEHLRGQTRCRDEADSGSGEAGLDAKYENLVACWPEPNRKNATPYGADYKHDWPENAVEDALFVSPLRNDCTRRFKFDRQGNISATRGNDEAAKTTISKLGLDHPELSALRAEAIRGSLAPLNRPLSRPQVARLRQVMDDDEKALNNGKNVGLRAFCFVIRPLLDKEIKKLEGIERSKKVKKK